MHRIHRGEQHGAYSGKGEIAPLLYIRYKARQDESQPVKQPDSAVYVIGLFGVERGQHAVYHSSGKAHQRNGSDKGGGFPASPSPGWRGKRLFSSAPLHRPDHEAQRKGQTQEDTAQEDLPAGCEILHYELQEYRRPHAGAYHPPGIPAPGKTHCRSMIHPAADMAGEKQGRSGAQQESCRTGRGGQDCGGCKAQAAGNEQGGLS